jgi:hypothetical protein
MKLSRLEEHHLWIIGRPWCVGPRESGYFFARKTMAKLAAKGLVEPHPNNPRGWWITEAGIAARNDMWVKTLEGIKQ